MPSAKASSTTSPLGSFIDVDTSVSLETFHDRLLTVDAAQHYVRGEAGAFETTRTPSVAHDLLGEYAVGPPITSRLFQVPLVGLLMAGSIGLLAWTRFYRMRAMKASRVWLSAIRLQPVAMSTVESWLASRLPTVWSSRVHASIPSLLVLVLLGTLLVGELVQGTLLWVVAPAVVVVGFATLRAQENARHLTCGPWQPLVIFLLHWSSIGLFAAVIGRLLGVTTGAPFSDVPPVMWLIALVGAMLQNARFSSALLSYFAAIIATAVTAGAIGLAEMLRTMQLTSLSNGTEFAVIFAITEGLAGLSVYLSVRFEAPPTIKRLVVGVFILLTTLGGILLSLILIPGADAVTFPKTVASAVLITTVVGVALRLTANYRRVLALGGR